jgi:hypothetical protein
MIERYVRGHRYLSVPGGRLEAGESPEQAALREIEEELGLQVTLSGRLPDYDGQAYFLAVVPEEVKLRMSGPEVRHSNRNNRYTPRWVDAATLDGLPLRQPVRPLVVTAAIAVAATVPVVESVVKTELGTLAVAPVGPEPLGENESSGQPIDDHPVKPDAPVIDLTAARGPLDLPLLEPRAEFDPAAATFAFGQVLRRRFTFRARGRTYQERRDERIRVRN